MTTTTELTKERILHLLATNDRAVGRALEVLLARQTDDEQRSEDTKYRNNRGFTHAHAGPMTGMAKAYKARGYLTPRQLAWLRGDTKRGMRIGMYWAQLLEEAQAKRALATSN